MTVPTIMIDRRGSNLRFHRSDYFSRFAHFAEVSPLLDLAGTEFVLPESQDTTARMLTAIGQVERRRLAAFLLTLEHRRPDTCEWRVWKDFLDLISGRKAIDVGRLLWSYQFGYALWQLERELSGEKSQRDPFGFIRAPANYHAYERISGCGNGSNITIVFDCSGKAYFPQTDLVLDGTPALASAVVECRLEGGLIIGETSECQVVRFQADSISEKFEIQNSQGKQLDDSKYNRIGHRDRIYNTQILIDNTEWILEKALLENVVAMNNAFEIGGWQRPSDEVSYVSTFDPTVRGILADAVEAIRDVWPDAFTDLHTFTQVVTPFDIRGPGLAGSSSRHLPGVVFQRITPSRVDVQAANLLHENAHKRYMLLSTLARFLENDGTERVKSPWRMDPRPIRGVLYGLHAFSVVAEFLSRALDARVTWAYGLERKLETEIDRLREGIDTVTRYGKFTDFGAAMFDGIRTKVRSLM